MADRTGLFTEPVPGTPPLGTAPIDGRLVLGGLYGTNFSIVSGGAVSQDSGDMGITVGATVWQVPDPSNSAGVFLSPSDPVSVSPAVGPTTGARVDLIEVKQNDYGNGDADSRVKVLLKAGTAASSPVAPAPDAGFQPAFTVLVPTNATNAAACTVSQVPQVALGPRPLKAATYGGLAAVTGLPTQRATVYGDTPAMNGDYVWSGSSWMQVLAHGTFSPNGTWTAQDPLQWQLAGNVCILTGTVKLPAEWSNWNPTAGDKPIVLPFPAANYGSSIVTSSNAGKPASLSFSPGSTQPSMIGWGGTGDWSGPGHLFFLNGATYVVRT